MLIGPLLLPLGLLVFGGQVPRVVPDVAIAEAEYRDAEAAWIQNDPNLEKELLTARPEEMRKRIRRAAALRDDLMEKQIAYQDILIRRLGDLRNRLEPDDGKTLPTEALKRDLEAEQTQILEEQLRQEALLRDLPVGDEYTLVRRALESEVSSLVNLQNKLALRIRSLEVAGKAQEAMSALGKDDSLTAKLDAMLEAWKTERTSTIKRRSTWTRVYAKMESAVKAEEERSSIPANKDFKRPPKRPSVVPSEADLSVKLPPPQTWFYQSQANSWSGYGEPQVVTLELSGSRDLLTGTYSAKLPVRGAVHEIRLTLSGRRQGDNAPMRWKSETPAAEGEITLKFSPDGKLLLERTQSSDSYIPKGMEILILRR